MKKLLRSEVNEVNKAEAEATAELVEGKGEGERRSKKKEKKRIISGEFFTFMEIRITVITY